MVGKGPGATSIPLDLARFTLVGATTRSGMLPNPLRDRFGFTVHLEFYSTAELTRVLERAAKIMGFELGQQALALIASRSRGTPRIANRLLRRVRDYAIVRGSGESQEVTVAQALDLYEVDAQGLDRLDRAVLEALAHKFQAKPVGLTTLAVAVGEEPETIETVVEPFLIREGLISRTPRGRQITPAGLAHLA